MMRPDILTSYCLTKAAACHLENGPVDVRAILHAKPRDGDELIWQLQVDGNPVEHLASALAFMVAGVGPLEWAGLLSDCHVKNEDVDAPRPRPGEFAAEHASVPDTTVREALTLTWRDSNGGSGMDVVTYSYPDGPIPVFDPVVHHRLAGGATDTALRTVLPPK